MQIIVYKLVEFFAERCAHLSAFFDKFFCCEVVFLLVDGPEKSCVEEIVEGKKKVFRGLKAKKLDNTPGGVLQYS